MCLCWIRRPTRPRRVSRISGSSSDWAAVCWCWNLRQGLDTSAKRQIRGSTGIQQAQLTFRLASALIGVQTVRTRDLPRLCGALSPRQGLDTSAKRPIHDPTGFQEAHLTSRLTSSLFGARTGGTLVLARKCKRSQQTWNRPSFQSLPRPPPDSINPSPLSSSHLCSSQVPVEQVLEARPIRSERTEKWACV
jgi:hypothetical protein